MRTVAEHVRSSRLAEAANDRGDFRGHACARHAGCVLGSGRGAQAARRRCRRLLGDRALREHARRRAKLLSLSWWRDEEAVRAWREMPEHRAAQRAGKDAHIRELSTARRARRARVTLSRRERAGGPRPRSRGSEGKLLSAPPSLEDSPSFSEHRVDLATHVLRRLRAAREHRIHGRHDEQRARNTDTITP